MKIGNIVNTNQKGQLVIPAAIRTELGITDQVPLQLLIKGGALYIVPIKEVVTTVDSDNSYLDILKKTKGSWQGEKNILAERKKIEVAASTKRKQAW